MLCRALMVALLVLGTGGLASAQNDDDGLDAFSNDDGTPAGGRDRNNGQGQGRRGRAPEDAQGRGGFGRGGRGRSNPLFEALDTDSDGMISVKELRRAAANLKTLDQDGDGNISLDEASPQRGPGGLGSVDRLMENDKNGDGKLTPDEVPEFLARMLTGADLNADGAIDKQELEQAMTTMRDRFRGGRGGGPGAGGPGAGGPGGGFGPGGFGGGGFGDPEAMTKQLMAGDTNGDGALSPEEVSPQMLGMLRGADANGDGVLDAKEVAQAMQSAQARFQRFRQGQQGGGNFRPPGRGND